jgi:hypothetical protein
MYLIGIGIVLVCALFLVHLVWSAGAGKSLNRQVAALRAAGEPIEFAVYATTQPLADEDNGAIDLRDAYKTLSDRRSPLWQEFDKQTLDLPLVEKEIKLVREVVKENAKAYEGVDAAMGRKGVDWRIAITSPSINVMLPHLSEARQLANRVGARATLEFAAGDHAAALGEFRRLEFLGKAADRPPTLLISHLGGIGINAIATDLIQKMAPTLKIGAEPGAVSKQQLAELIARLLDEKAQREGLIRAFQGERTFQLDTVRCIADGTLNIQQLSGVRPGMAAPSPAASALNFAIKPIALEDGGIMLQYDTKLLEAIKKSPDWPTFRSLNPGLPPEFNNMRHLVLRMLLPSLERAIENDLRSCGERRAAAVALAARWYAVEHDGKMPKSWDELVPKYLPGVPLDPYAKAQAMRYVGLPTTQPIVYSVGENGTDDGGSEQNRFNRPYFNKWNSLDIVTHLTPQPREQPPAEDEPSADGSAVDGQAESIYPKETIEAARRAATQGATVPTTRP